MGIDRETVEKTVDNLRKAMFSILGIRKTKNDVAHALVMFLTHLSSFRYSPVLVCGLAATKKKKSIKSMYKGKFPGINPRKPKSPKKPKSRWSSLIFITSPPNYNLNKPNAQRAGIIKPSSPESPRYLSSSFQYLNSENMVKHPKRKKYHGLWFGNARKALKPIKPKNPGNPERILLTPRRILR